MYVDFGNKETVSKRQLRVLHRDLMDEPLLRYVCKLHDLMPVNLLF